MVSEQSPDGTDGERVSFTEPYQGDPDDWTVDDPKHGFNVPDIVRQGGTTNPMEKQELSGNGTSYRSDNFAFKCEECGAIRRFATSDFMTTYWCRECSDTRWFRFDWDLNRRSVPTATEQEEQ
jgi:predicted RNA-binding Zn-ribbon protein involved in translation (DUF1610 family)